ncbi:MAG: hypothetical protein Q8R20_01450 [Nanoarchaeota archaeon]|nr:hypothetical protein [Nanoarchaeota archaeon]
MKRNLASVLALTLVLGVAFGATAQKAVTTEVAKLKRQPAPTLSSAPTPAPAPTVVVPPGTATRTWVNSNFASIPDDFDFAAFYVAAGLNEVQARTRLATKLGELRKRGKPVYLEVIFAVMADAVAVAREHPKFTEDAYEAIAFEVVGHIEPEDLMTAELVALVEAKAGAKATEVAKAELVALQQTAKEIMGLAKSTNELLSGRATAVDELKQVARHLQETLDKYVADIARFAAVEHLDKAAVQGLIDAALLPVKETLAAVKEQQGKIGMPLLALATALATNDTEKVSGRRAIRKTATAAVVALRYELIKP